MDSHTKARYEKDIRELKKMCDDHFKKREEDEKEFVALQERIAKRQELRATQMEAKVAKEKERAEKERVMAEEKAAEEARIKEEMEEEKMRALNSLNAGQSFKQQGQSRRLGRHERELKKKTLAERRKPLNVDHLPTDKLIEKISDMYQYLITVEKERAQAELQIDTVKHNVQIAKGSLNVSIAKMAKTKNNKRRMTVAKAF